MRSILGIGLATVLFFAAEASAAVCKTPDTVVEEMKSVNVGIEVIAKLDGMKADQFMAAVNAFTSSQRPEREILIMGGDRFNTLVFLFQHGCATKVGKFPPQLVEEWLNGIVG